MRSPWLAPMCAAAAAAVAFAAAPLTPFSEAVPGTQLPGAWRPLTLPNVGPAELSLVHDSGTTVLRVRSVAAAGSASHPVDAEYAGQPVLSWR